MSKNNLQNAIEESRGDISDLDDSLMMEVVGVKEAVDCLRKSLDQLEVRLDERSFEKASALGYQDIGSNFIFLQRTLGGLQQQVNKKSALISDIAARSGVGVYETVAPFVDALLQSSKPLTAEQKKKNQKAAKKLGKQFLDTNIATE